MQDHLFTSDTDGALHDTRDPNWSSTPLRAAYRRSHRNINTVSELKATLRAGGYAWPGGYPLYFITSDGAALSFEAVRNEFAQCVWSIANECDDGWRVVGCEINDEDHDLFCAHTNERIQSSY